MSGFDPQAVLDLLVSHAEASGYFDAVIPYEPKSSPRNGVTVAIWADGIQATTSSGLASTSIHVVFNLRVYTNMLQEPQEAIEPKVLDAVAALFTAYVGDFTLGGQARHIDVLGAHGQALRAQAGYVNHDNTLYRVMTIFFPVIFNDVFAQVA